MDEKFYLTVYPVSQKDEKRKNAVVLRKASFGLIFGVFAASFAFTFLVFDLRSRLASERGIGDTPVRRAPWTIPSIDRGPKAGAVAQVSATTTTVSIVGAGNVPVPEIRARVPLQGGSASKQVEAKSEPDQVFPLEDSHTEPNQSVLNPIADRAAPEPVQQLQLPAVDEQNSSSPPTSLNQHQLSAVRAEERQQLATISQPQAHAEDEEDAWNSVDRTSEESARRFLERYPDGGHAPAARELIRSLSNQEQAHKLNVADDRAWDSVSSADRHSLERYLTEFPSGKHIGQARQWLSEISSSASSGDANAVIATLERYSDAWNAKDVADITAIRPGLGRRTAKEELSSVRSIVMRIRPTSVPKIQGDRATVECIHQVDQVFNDGVEKQNPGVRMTYVLVKRGGNWQIAEAR